MLDEQCRLPRCTDKTFSSAVYDKCESNSYFAASRMQKSEGRFVIVHYGKNLLIVFCCILFGCLCVVRSFSFLYCH